MEAPSSDEKVNCPCKAIYDELYADMGRILGTSLSGGYGVLQNRSHTRAEDFQVWMEVLGGRPEIELLDSAFREYQFGLAALATGVYRQAFGALRGFVEGSLGAVYLSAKEVYLRLWLKGKRDLFWGNVTDENKGIYSNDFVQAFCDDIRKEVKHCRAMAVKVYRETSEYIHGNPSAQRALPKKLIFVPEAYEAWHEKAEAAIYVVHFSLFMRYGELLSDEEIGKLESVLSGNLGHLTAVQRRLNVERGAQNG